MASRGGFLDTVHVLLNTLKNSHDESGKIIIDTKEDLNGWTPLFLAGGLLEFLLNT